jgi:hypothetical protein
MDLHNLIAGVAAVAVGVAGGALQPAHAISTSTTLPYHFRCEITDTQFNRLTYDFVNALDDRGAVAESQFTKNGAIIADPSMIGTNVPYWTSLNDPYSQVPRTILLSRRAPGWSITFLTNVTRGEAVLWHNDNRIGDGHCFNVTPAPGSPSIPAPDTTTVPSNVVPFVMNAQGGMTVRVMVGGRGLYMEIDTGAAMSSVTEEVAKQMLDAGVARESEVQQFVLADGSVTTSRTIIVTSLTMGGHTLNDVQMSVAPNSAMTLLGLPVLNAIGKFTIDSTNHQLIFS